MTDQAVYVTLALSGLAGVGVVSTAALSGWRSWLRLKQVELDRVPSPLGAPSAGARIEIADLKERIRKLEAIAAGVEL